MGNLTGVWPNVEGWVLSEAHNEASQGKLELQRLDEAGVFASDLEAVRFVIGQAKEGSRRHKAALEEWRKSNSKDYANMTFKAGKVKQ